MVIIIRILLTFRSIFSRPFLCDCIIIITNTNSVVVSRDEREISELSLSRGTNDHEVQEILNTEFRRATSRPGKKVEGEGEREAKTEREEERGREEREEQKGKEDGGEEKGREKRRGDGGGGRGGLIFAARRDPGMSILQDSVFGLTADGEETTV